MLVLIVTFTPLVSWWTSLLSGPWPDSRGQTLIVLGSESSMGNLLGLSSYWRTSYAALAWREGGWAKVVVSGKEVGPEMQHFLQCSGVPGDKIVVENRSTTTRENALECAAIVRGLAGRNVLMTSDYHMFRAIRCFRKAGLQVEPRPIPDAGKRGSWWVTRWSAFLDLTIETSKIGYYFVRGWI